VTSSRALSDAAIWRLDLPRAVNVIRLGEKFPNLSGEIAVESAAASPRIGEDASRKRANDRIGHSVRTI